MSGELLLKSVLDLSQRVGFLVAREAVLTIDAEEEPEVREVRTAAKRCGLEDSRVEEDLRGTMIDTAEVEIPGFAHRSHPFPQVQKGPLWFRTAPPESAAGEARQRSRAIAPRRRAFEWRAVRGSKPTFARLPPGAITETSRRRRGRDHPTRDSETADLRGDGRARSVTLRRREPPRVSTR